jgi:phage-related tail protein
MAAGGKYKGYATGTNGPLKKSEWAWVGEQGPELMRLRRGTEVFSHSDSMNIASGSYNPTSLTSTFSSSGSRGSFTYSPTVYVTVEGSSPDSNIEQRIQKAVDVALDAHYRKLLALFGTEVEI